MFHGLWITKLNDHFSEQNVRMTRLQMELCSPLNQKPAFYGFIESFDLELKVMRMKNKCVSRFLISSMFTSDSQYPTTYMHKCKIKAMVSLNASH